MQSVLMRSGMLGLGRLGLGLTRNSVRSDLRVPTMAQRSEAFGSAGFSSTGAGGSIPRAGPQLPSSVAPKGNPLKRLISMRSVGGGIGGASVPPNTGGGGGGGGGSSSSGGGLWAGYLRSLESNPILTKSLTAAVLNAIGDLIAQFYVEKRDKLDVGRFVRFAGLGLIMIGPVLHYWYGLNTRIAPGAGTGAALLRLAMDQLLFAPPFVALNFATLKLLEGKPQDAIPKLKQDWKDAIIANWKLWPFFQFVNFRFVPPEQRVLFSSMVSLIWNAYLSFAGHIELRAPELPLPGKK